MRFSRPYTASILVLLLLMPQPGLFAQAAATRKPALSIDAIMRGPGLVGYDPQNVRWSLEGSKLFFQWKKYSDPVEAPLDTYAVSRDGSNLKKLSDEEAKQAPPIFGQSTKEKKWTVFADQGDLFLYDHAKGERRQLTRTSDVESQPRFLKDERRISFVRGGNLFVMALDTPMVEQVTDIRAAGAVPAVAVAPTAGRGGRGGGGATAAVSTEDQKGTDSQEFLKKEERDLLDVVRDRAKRREEADAKKKKENPRKPMTLTARQTVIALELSPDEKNIIATIQESGEGSKTAAIPNFVTESTYTEQIPSRTNVGDQQGWSRLALIDAASGAVKWVEHGQTIAPEKGTTPIERPAQLSAPIWNEEGTRAVLQARAADNKDRWLLSLDPASGKTKVLVSMHDDAWINQLGASTLGWLKNGQEIYYQSERDGYAHLYKVSADGGEAQQLTSGKFEVTGVQLSRDKTKFYLTSSEASPSEYHFYSMPVEGGARTKLTTTIGRHAVTLSPDEQWMADIYSYTTKPPELFAQPATAGAAMAKLTNSPAPEFWDYSWLDAPIVRIPARDGAMVAGKFFKPANFRKGGPAVIFVHGAGYAQNVHKGWPANYYREYMFHHYLMEHGYAVLDLDYRASSGYGRDWRTGIYRFMGGKDLDDQVDGAKWLVSEQGVDARKIGIYGGSYGGFITLMAMFTQPEVFAAGAALRPVTDWAHYNHGYTSNILNAPQKDAEAYRKSSPIYHAAGLKGALLICHGMVDVNVHFQDTVRLVQRLVELRKENWETAIYPVEDHGFVQPSSWADEYKRIFKLFEKNLKN